VVTSPQRGRRRRLTVDAAGRRGARAPARVAQSRRAPARHRGHAAGRPRHLASPGEFGWRRDPGPVHQPPGPRAHPYYATIAGLVVSAHFLIRRDGSLIQFVACSERAWHAGASAWKGRERCNDYSIGVELEGADAVPYAAAQYAMLARLAKALRRRYPIADIVGHSDVAPGRKTDPGPSFDWPGCTGWPRPREPGPGRPAERDPTAGAGVRGQGIMRVMQLLADYFPLLLLHRVQVAGIYFATAVAIAASVVQIALLRWKRGRVAPVHWLSLAIIVVFGGATLILHDEVFIKWKPTCSTGSSARFSPSAAWASAATSSRT